MQPNPYLAKLGYPDDARLAILHTDDLGMCGASFTAYADLLDAGIITSAATMVPCPWFPAVAQFCREHGVPMNLPRLDIETALQRSDMQEMGVNADELVRLLMGLKALEAQGVPLLDGIYEFPLDLPEGRLDLLRHVINHAAMDTPELRAITSDWRGRVADYQCFTSQAARDIIKESGVQLIGYRALRDELRGEG